MTTELREQIQTALGDAYTIERELGGGGMSRVFLAHETALGRRVVSEEELLATVTKDDKLGQLVAQVLRLERARAQQQGRGRAERTHGTSPGNCRSKDVSVDGGKFTRATAPRQRQRATL
ncbi:MAG: hypothetical protein H0W67_07105 [Gemmatimonadales bacterium]|nr:hypothetical protein [Gemmatimonadales bacterium]